ncbi:MULTISPECIES: ATP-binding protein [unclassified Streptomyces]|uniref:ATP-binding protein n=1 Tax=unclassified Streptomyces TaxID=2593676 RepID=UPI002DDC1D33|nr:MULTISPECIES: ATP-binding protein [unclassified Streptomyces]WSA94085.1 sensor histidine kinase [Streptomyces sp. NBC_01795]WSB78510.1 sensor histidine kinase [Streptomyces sp. NBC_01775]WSS42077.1 sensor histidine kinase [Streptomyces sp. NBC_01187]
MTEIPVALTVILSVGTAAAVALAFLLARSRGETKRLRKRSSTLERDLQTAAGHQAALTARVQGTEAEVRHLAGARLPDLTAALAHPNVPVRGPLDPAVAGSELDRALTAVLDQVGDAVAKERLRVDGAAQAAMRGATTTIQALLYQLQTRLQLMQERYDDPGIAEDLLAADFLNEQALRRIQSTAVVCGAWPGLTRQNSHLSDIVVGAMSRLSGYERVQIANQLRDPVGVVARAVEPVAVVLTELIGNALHFSHPDLPVPVTLQQGNRGASVIIDDAGVGMHTDELANARHMMAGPDTVLLTELGDPPRTGLAAVGQLVRQYGFTTHVEASPYGGVRAIVHIPGEPLLTLLDEVEQPMSAMAPLPPTTPPLPGRTSTQHAPAPSSAPLEPATDWVGGASGDTAPATGSAMTEDAESELPRRRRRRPDPEAGAGIAPAPGAQAAPAATTEPEAAAPEASPEQSAERWAAFQRGTSSGRAAADGGSAEDPAHGGAADDHHLADPHSAEGNPLA